MARGRKTVYATIILVLAVVALPFSAFAVASVSSMFPMHTCPKPCEAGMSCMGSCPMLVQVNSRSGQKSLPRSSPGKSSPYPCSSTFQSDTQRISIEGMIGTNGRVSGLRRIYPNNVLDHPQRKAVYDIVVANPGIDLGKIGKVLNLNRETLRYHMDLLASSNKIVVMKDHGIIRYYENHGRYGILERRVLAYFWNLTAEQILSIVFSNPGITQKDIASKLSISSPTVNWYMKRFTIDEIVTAQRTGRLTNYYITSKALRVLTDFPRIRQNLQAEVYG
jgi:predicted transcriptional regulator